jgi:hypothetical protein
VIEEELLCCLWSGRHRQFSLTQWVPDIKYWDHRFIHIACGKLDCLFQRPEFLVKGTGAAHSPVTTAEVPRAKDGVSPVREVECIVPGFGCGMCEGQHSQGLGPAKGSRHKW